MKIIKYCAPVFAAIVFRSVIGAGTDCPPVTHGSDCTHKRPNIQKKACGTGGFTCQGASIYVCYSTTATVYTLFPDGIIDCETQKKGDQDCWVGHTNVESLDSDCSFTMRCMWDEINLKCVGDLKTRTGSIGALKPTAVPCPP